MNTELAFRIALALIGSIYALIRVYYTRKALQWDKKFFRPRKDLRQLVYGTVGFLIIVPVVIYVFAPQQMAWAALLLPAGWRWLGVGLGLAGIFLLLWVHRTLDKNFAQPAVMRERQALVTTGPYRWVRHPMYTAFFLITVVYFLISANWFIGVVWLGWVVGVVASMIRDEEAALMNTFGDEYQAYMQRTGRFLPRLS